MILLSTILCACGETNSRMSSTESTNSAASPNYITVDSSIEIPDEKKMPKYTAPYQSLYDTNKIIAAFFSPNESITTKDLSDEGIYVIKSDTGQLQTIMQNFTFYAIKKGKRIFDDYTYWLSLDTTYIQDMNYSFLSSKYGKPVDANMIVKNKCESIIDAIDSPFEVVNYRNEAIDIDGITNLIDDMGGDVVKEAMLENNVTFPKDVEITRSFFQFFVHETPILAPDRNMVYGGARLQGTIYLPYIEILCDQNGIEYIYGAHCPINMKKSKEDITTVKATVALETFKKYFDDMILTEENAIVIDSINIQYVMTTDSKTITLIPAWIIGYKQNNQKYCIAVDAETGEML